MANDQPTPNPAVERHFSVAPVLLEEVEKDPELLSRTTRKMVFIQSTDLHRLIRMPGVTINQKIAALDLLAKISGVYTKAPVPIGAAAAGGGVSIHINVPQMGAKPAQVIEMNAPAAPAEAASKPLVIEASNERPSED